MTIGPAPMMRIEEISVRLGMSLGDIWARPRHKKKGAPVARPSGGAEVRPRARALFRLESAGRKGWPGQIREAGITCLAHARRAMKVMRAWLWPILLATRRAANPAPASLASMAASP